jgi:hypothetical protein
VEKQILMRFLLFFALFAFFYGQMTSCDQANIPLDAESRRMVDSLSASQISNERRINDSLCKQYDRTLLPHLVDSIKQVRLQQIEEQIRRAKTAQ